MSAESNYSLLEREEIDEIARDIEERDIVDVMQDNDYGAYDFRNQKMGAEEAYRLGLSLASMYGESADVIVGRDHREESEKVRDGLIAGLEDAGCDAEYIGLAPTDMVSYLVSETDALGGVNVTASHMKPGYRGIKPLNKDGRIFNAEELKWTSGNYKIIEAERDFFPEVESKFDERYFTRYHVGLMDRYEELFENYLSDIEVVVDPGNGVGAETLPSILRFLGVRDDNLHTINGELDTGFPARGPDPTVDGSLEQLSSEVLEKEADLGMALDGDADRIKFVNEKGENVPESESLAILAEKYLKAESPEDTPGRIVVSANTSKLVEDRIRYLEGIIDYLPVGAVFTAEEGIRDEKMVFGGQPNGHYLDPCFTPYDSETLIGAVMAGIVNDRDENLSELQEELPSYITSKKNIDMKADNWRKEFPGIISGTDLLAGSAQIAPQDFLEAFKDLPGEEKYLQGVYIKDFGIAGKEEKDERIRGSGDFRMVARESGSEDDVLRIISEIRDPDQAINLVVEEAWDSLLNK